MKKILIQMSLALTLIAGMNLQGCKSKPKDSDIQSSFNEKARTNAQLANISATVNEGVITLSGECPDDACKSSAEQYAHDIKGVKSVVNNISVAPVVAPVVISDDATINLSVGQVLVKYPGIRAEVQNGTVTLRGTIKRDNLQQLMMALNESNIRNINNQLVVQN